MSLVDNAANGMVMPVAPMNGNGYGGYGSMGFGDGLFWIIILFLFAFMGNGFGNGFNQGGAGADVQRGFDQQSVMNGINGLTSAVSNGFASAEVSRCNSQANILQTLNANQNATTASVNQLAMSLQNCCCENRAATADLKYTIATEACADRAAVSNALRDVIASNTANTQAILDKMCQQELDALKAQNASLQAQLNNANLQASQTAQTAQILANNEQQTASLLQRLNPNPIPAYVVQNPNTAGLSWMGCGCNA